MAGSLADFVQDQLGALAELRCRRMFGGHGLYLGESFFGIVHQERLYFNTSDATRKEFVNAGMTPFQPNERQTLKSYFEVPAAVIEDRGRLIEWAREAAAIA